jgi:hypothetical protein
MTDDGRRLYRRSDGRFMKWTSGGERYLHPTVSIARADGQIEVAVNNARTSQGTWLDVSDVRGLISALTEMADQIEEPGNEPDTGP